MKESLRKNIKKSSKPIQVSLLSELDAEIMDNLIVALGKLNATKIKAILDDYKIKPDSEIRDALLDYNLNFDSSDKVNQNKYNYIRNFIDIGNVSLEVKYIKKIGTYENYDYEKADTTDDCWVYYILINEDESSIMTYANTAIAFSNFEEREKTLAQIKEKLKKYNIIFI